MIKVTLPSTEYYDEETSTFIEQESRELLLEHSLVSLSKWESKWKESFLSNDNLTEEQTLDYIRCMVLDDEVTIEDIKRLTPYDLDALTDYISDPMTATTFPQERESKSREKITSELIYFWMVSAQVPFECQFWHLSRLLTLLRVISVKNEPPKKRSAAEIAQENRRLNEERRRMLNTKG